MRQLLTVCSEKSISSPANKGLQGLKTPKLSYWEYCCFLDHFYKLRDCFYIIFCLDCFLFILKCAKTTTTKEESRHEKSCGRNRYNKITELSGPGCLYNISCIRKGLKEFVRDMVSARTIALFHHSSGAKSPAKPSKTLIKQIWALHSILATAGRFIK